MARARAAERGSYYGENDTIAASGLAALTTFGWGPGAIPAHPNAEQFEEWGRTCDADGVHTFDSMFGLGIRGMAAEGETFFVWDRDKLRMLPAAQCDDSLSRDLGDGIEINNGIESGPNGRIAYHFLRSLPTTQFERYSEPVRVLAEDVVHLFRATRTAQHRGLSWLAPAMLKLAEVNMLQDALQAGVRVSALNSVYLVDKNSPGGLPFEGEQSSDTIEVSAEPGATRILRGEWGVHTNAPQQSQQGMEFLNSQVNSIASSLGVCPFMCSGDFSKSSYSNLRASLLTMKSHVQAWQWSTVVPALNKIWARWALLERLRGSDIDESMPTWRFPAFPSADSIKDAQEAEILLKTKLASRRELIEARGEDIARVDRDIAADPHAQAEEEEESDDA